MTPLHRGRRVAWESHPDGGLFTVERDRGAVIDIRDDKGANFTVATAELTLETYLSITRNCIVRVKHDGMYGVLTGATSWPRSDEYEIEIIATSETRRLDRDAFEVVPQPRTFEKGDLIEFTDVQDYRSGTRGVVQGRQHTEYVCLMENGQTYYLNKPCMRLVTRAYDKPMVEETYRRISESSVVTFHQLAEAWRKSNDDEDFKKLVTHVYGEPE